MAALAVGLVYARRGTALSVTYLLDSGGDAASLRVAVRDVQSLVTVDAAVRARTLGLLRRAATQSERPSQGDRYRRPASALQARPAQPG